VTCHIYSNFEALKVCPLGWAASKSIVEATRESVIKLKCENPWRLFMRSINIIFVMIMWWRCPRYLDATSHGMRSSMRGNIDIFAYIWEKVCNFIYNSLVYREYIVCAYNWVGRSTTERQYISKIKLRYMTNHE